MGRRLVASSILILSPFIAFAPAAMGQRTAGNGYAPSSGTVAAAPRSAVAPQTMAAPAHAQAQAVRAPVMSRTAANVNVPAHASVHVAHAQNAAGPVSTRGEGAAVGVHRVSPAGIQPRRLNVMSGLGHLPLSSTDFADSPGLGFDFSHAAAINGGNGIDDRRLRDRVNAGVPFGFGGFLLSPEVIVVDGQQGEAPAAATEANAAANGSVEGGGPDAERENLQDQFAPASLGPAAPVRDAAEYVFVRRDGSLVFAVGYSWDHGTLRYITRDGLRRSISQDALDMDATQQFNEQRGVSFRTPA